MSGGPWKSIPMQEGDTEKPEEALIKWALVGWQVGFIGGGNMAGKFS